MDYQSLIERLRKDRGKWLHIGRECGVDQSLISRYVAGKTQPKVANFEKLVRHYKRKRRTTTNQAANGLQQTT